jgi:hypothetical protein
MTMRMMSAIPLWKWVEIRRRVLSKEISKRQACRDYKVPWRTLQRILEHVEPPRHHTKLGASKSHD